MTEAHAVSEQVKRAIRSDARVEAIAEALGDPPRSLRLLDTGTGPVVTVGLTGEPDLTEAHRLAGELEVTLRERHPGLAEVVVHTEPVPPEPAG